MCEPSHVALPCVGWSWRQGRRKATQVLRHIKLGKNRFLYTQRHCQVEGNLVLLPQHGKHDCVRLSFIGSGSKCAQEGCLTFYTLYTMHDSIARFPSKPSVQWLVNHCNSPPQLCFHHRSWLLEITSLSPQSCGSLAPLTEVQVNQWDNSSLQSSSASEECLHN